MRVSRVLLVALLGLLCGLCVSAQSLEGKASVDGLFELTYKINEETIDFVYKVKRETWIAFGVSADPVGKMKGTDATICIPEGSLIRDVIISGNGFQFIKDDATNSVSNGKIEQGGGFTTCTFSRPLDSGETEDNFIDITGVNTFVYSMGKGNAFDGVPHEIRGVLIINLATGESQSEQKTDPYIVAHGSLMILGWLILAPGAILSARHFKMYDPLWFTIHQRFQYTAIICIFTAFFLIVAYTANNGLPHFVVVHQKLGLAIVIIAFVQFWIGVTRPHKEKNKPKSEERVVFEWAHRTMGRILPILAVINCFIAAFQFAQIKASETAFRVWVILPIIVYGMAFVILEVKAIMAEPSKKQKYELEPESKLV